MTETLAYCVTAVICSVIFAVTFRRRPSNAEVFRDFIGSKIDRYMDQYVAAYMKELFHRVPSTFEKKEKEKE